MSKSVDSIFLANPVSFSRACAVAMRVLTAPELAGKVFLEGGLVPWAISGRDSGRLHGDVDLSVHLADMPAVRAWLTAEGLYDPALDSLSLACNVAGGDFGLHAVVDGVLVSFCPFALVDGSLEQRNACLRGTDGFDALLAARAKGLFESDFIELRELPDRRGVGFSTLEACRAAKMGSGREKDAHDIAEIDRIGVDAGRLERVLAAFSAMEVECVAHEE